MNTAAVFDSVRLTLIVPTFNEAGNLAPLCRRITRALQGISHEILVVDDGSPDGTAAVAEELARTRYPQLRVLRRIGPRGLSAAVLDGFAAARGAVLGVMDADLQHDPRDLPRLLALVEGGRQVAVGSRYAFQGLCRGWSFVRELQSRAAAALTRTVLGLSVQDPLSGFFVVRAATFASLRPAVAATGWKVLLELLARLPAEAAAEAPIVFRPRLRGQTKMHAGVIGAWLVQLTGLWRLRAASAPITEATA